MTLPAPRLTKVDPYMSHWHGSWRCVGGAAVAFGNTPEKAYVAWMHELHNQEKRRKQQASDAGYWRSRARNLYNAASAPWPVNKMGSWFLGWIK